MVFEQRFFGFSNRNGVHSPVKKKEEKRQKKHAFFFFKTHKTLNVHTKGKEKKMYDESL